MIWKQFVIIYDDFIAINSHKVEWKNVVGNLFGWEGLFTLAIFPAIFAAIIVAIS